MTQAVLQAQDNTVTTRATLYMALELSKGTWKVGFAAGSGTRARIVDVMARNRERLLEEVRRSKKRFRLPDDAEVVSCYEAGRDGFWIHRWLVSEGIQNVIVEPASIEVNRRKRRAKTDRLDVKKLLSMLVRHHGGEEDVWRIVRVPSPGAEAERLLPRQLRRLKKERTSLSNRMRSALFREGIDQDPKRRGFLELVEEARRWDGTPLPPRLRAELGRDHARLELLKQQIRELEKEQKERVKAGSTAEATPIQEKAMRLSQLRGIGIPSAYVLSTEFFGWRAFSNRREVGALAGLTGTPYDSGNDDREQGISKAGNPRVRTLMVELGWSWLRYQPQSKLARWFAEFVGRGKKRRRRVAIVAVARRLLVDLWHYLEHGTIPDGAVFKAGV